MRPEGFFFLGRNRSHHRPTGTITRSWWRCSHVSKWQLHSLEESVGLESCWKQKFCITDYAIALTLLSGSVYKNTGQKFGRTFTFNDYLHLHLRKHLSGCSDPDYFSGIAKYLNRQWSNTISGFWGSTDTKIANNHYVFVTFFVFI